MLPESRSGNTNTLALPATSEPRRLDVTDRFDPGGVELQLTVDQQVRRGLMGDRGSAAHLVDPRVSCAPLGREREHGDPRLLTRQLRERRRARDRHRGQLPIIGIGQHSTVAVDHGAAVGQHQQEAAAHRFDPRSDPEHPQPGPHHIGTGTAGAAHTPRSPARLDQSRGHHQRILNIQTTAGPRSGLNTGQFLHEALSGIVADLAERAEVPARQQHVGQTLRIEAVGGPQSPLVTCISQNDALRVRPSAAVPVFENAHGEAVSPSPARGINLFSAIRMATSMVTPRMLIRITADSIRSSRKNWRALKMVKPRPELAPSSSAATRVPQQTPIATRSPVKISGSALGRMTWRSTCGFDAPSE